jgi:hypothetical protein
VPFSGEAELALLILTIGVPQIVDAADIGVAWRTSWCSESGLSSTQPEHDTHLSNATSQQFHNLRLFIVTAGNYSMVRRTSSRSRAAFSAALPKAINTRTKAPPVIKNSHGPE